MANIPGNFIWYELLTPDQPASESFYAGLLGWQYEDMDAGAPGYRVLKAGETYVGGLFKLTDEHLAEGAHPFWAGYVEVADLDAAAAKIEPAGGKILMPKTEIPGVGSFVFLQDPQGAMLYLMQSNPNDSSKAFSTHEPVQGACAWNELMTSDQAASKAFYAEVCGWHHAETMDMGPMGDYHMYKCSEQSDFLLAGMMAKPDEVPVSSWTYYFRVPDIDNAAAYVTANQGTMMMDPMEIPGGEYAFSAVDPQGAVFSVVGVRG